MEHTPLTDTLATWSAPAQKCAHTCRTLFHTIAKDADTGPLEESLKWGQPAWRPRTARTGATLRMHWDAATPDRLSLYVDCKTDLAARMQDIYPDLPLNDGQRHLGININAPLPEQALAHLAEMTFTYHRAKRQQSA